MYLTVMLISLVFTMPLEPQEQNKTSVEARVKAMQKLDLFVGEWKGSGWAMMEGGKRYTFTHVEKVDRKAGNTVLYAEGKSVRKNEKGAEVTMHDGLALLYYDEKTGRYHWDGHDLPWGAMHADLKLIDGGFEWGFKEAASGAKLRFIIKLTPTHWHEVGEVSMDGKTWNQFMETTLERVK